MHLSSLQIEALPEPRWERLFHRRTGWIGSDGAYSVPLGKERILWLFGDTYFGAVRNSQRVNARLVMGNTVAIQQGKEAQTVYRCPDIHKGKHVFCYAAKAHPELSAPDALLVTYATNSFEISEVWNDAELYVPRFVRLRFSR